MFVCLCCFCLGFHILSFPFFSLTAQNIQHLSSFPSNTILFYGAIECGIHFTNCLAKHRKNRETRKICEIEKIHCKSILISKAYQQMENQFRDFHYLWQQFAHSWALTEIFLNLFVCCMLCVCLESRICCCFILFFFQFKSKLMFAYVRSVCLLA